MTDLALRNEELAVCFRDKDRITFEPFLHVIDGKTTGALRASVELVTTFADVYPTRFHVVATRFTPAIRKQLQLVGHAI